MVPDVMLAAFMCSLAPSEYRERHSLSSAFYSFMHVFIAKTKEEKKTDRSI